METSILKSVLSSGSNVAFKVKSRTENDGKRNNDNFSVSSRSNNIWSNDVICLDDDMDSTCDKASTCTNENYLVNNSFNKTGSDLIGNVSASFSKIDNHSDATCDLTLSDSENEASDNNSDSVREITLNDDKISENANSKNASADHTNAERVGCTGDVKTSDDNSNENYAINDKPVNSNAVVESLANKNDQKSQSSSSSIDIDNLMEVDDSCVENESARVNHLKKNDASITRNSEDIRSETSTSKDASIEENSSELSESGNDSVAVCESEKNAKDQTNMKKNVLGKESPQLVEVCLAITDVNNVVSDSDKNEKSEKQMNIESIRESKSPSQCILKSSDTMNHSNIEACLTANQENLNQKLEGKLESKKKKKNEKIMNIQSDIDAEAAKQCASNSRIECNHSEPMNIDIPTSLDESDHGAKSKKNKNIDSGNESQTHKQCISDSNYSNESPETMNVDDSTPLNTPEQNSNANKNNDDVMSIESDDESEVHNGCISDSTNSNESSKAMNVDDIQLNAPGENSNTDENNDAMNVDDSTRLNTSEQNSNANKNNDEITNIESDDESESRNQNVSNSENLDGGSKLSNENSTPVVGPLRIEGTLRVKSLSELKNPTNEKSGEPSTKGLIRVKLSSEIMAPKINNANSNETCDNSQSNATSIPDTLATIASNDTIATSSVDMSISACNDMSVSACNDVSVSASNDVSTWNLRRNIPTEEIIRFCAQCRLQNIADEKSLTWQTLDFCNEDCLHRYQTILGYYCTTCKSTVPQAGIGKYCVRFGFDILQFCSLQCLDTHKKKNKICTYCQKDISSLPAGVHSSQENPLLFRDFCSEICSQTYEKYSSSKEVNLGVASCTVCKQNAIVKLKLTISGDSHALCGKVCYDVFTFKNKITNLMHCATCAEYFPPSKTQLYALKDETLHTFCNKICKNLFIVKNRNIVPCLMCKVKKYNFDMIGRKVKGQQIFMCSLNCVLNNIYTLNPNAIKKISCDSCKIPSFPYFYVLLNDSSKRFFCCHQCANKFTVVFGVTKNKNNLKMIGNIKRCQLHIERNIKEVSSKPSIEASSAVVNEKEETIKSIRDEAVVEHNATKCSAIPSSSFIQRIVIKPVEPPKLRNVSTSCRPNTHDAETTCTPCVKDESCQTDESLWASKIIPLPMPMYVPVPLHMFSVPYPVPLPLIVPFPVPVFLPTTCTNYADILKEIERIKNYIPADPLEAEILNLAAVAEESHTDGDNNDDKSDDAINDKNDDKSDDADNDKNDDKSDDAENDKNDDKSDNAVNDNNDDKSDDAETNDESPQSNCSNDSSSPLAIISDQESLSKSESNSTLTKDSEDQMVEPMATKRRTRGSLKRSHSVQSKDECPSQSSATPPPLEKRSTRGRASSLTQSLPSEERSRRSRAVSPSQASQQAGKSSRSRGGSPSQASQQSGKSSRSRGGSPSQASQQSGKSSRSRGGSPSQASESSEGNSRSRTLRPSQATEVPPSEGRSSRSKAKCASEGLKRSRSQRSESPTAKVRRVSKPAKSVTTSQQRSFDEMTLDEKAEWLADENGTALPTLDKELGMSVWKRWMHVKLIEEKKSGSRNAFRMELYQTDLNLMTVNQLVYLLCSFAKEMRSPSGKEYRADAVYYVFLCMQAHLKHVGRNDELFFMANCDKFTDIINEILLPLPTKNIATLRIIEEHLWTGMQLGCDSPHMLLNTLIFFNSKYFQMSTLKEHKQIAFGNILKRWKNGKDDSGGAILRYFPPKTKNSSADGEASKKRHLDQHPNEENPQRCPVKIYEFYISKCPESVKNRHDVFYLKPEISCISDSPIWYTAEPLSDNKLNKMITRAKVCREVAENMHSKDS